MILYHGSKSKVEKLERRQAGVKRGTIVPDGELLNAIYLTPDYAFAILSASRPSGLTESDEEKRTVKFERPERFDPEQDIFIYSIESENIPSENLKQVGEFQFAVVGLDEIEPENIEQKKAIEVTKYYKLENWTPKEKRAEISNEFNQKIR